MYYWECIVIPLPIVLPIQGTGNPPPRDRFLPWLVCYIEGGNFTVVDCALHTEVVSFPGPEGFEEWK